MGCLYFSQLIDFVLMDYIFLPVYFILLWYIFYYVTKIVKVLVKKFLSHCVIINLLLSDLGVFLVSEKIKTAVFVMIRAMAPEKKPLPILSWINLVLSIAAAVVFAFATKEIYDTGLFNPIQRQFNFNIYVGAAIGYGVKRIYTLICHLKTSITHQQSWLTHCR